MERFLTIDHDGAQLAAILHSPEALQGDRAVLIVVGGPQYRVGSHRMFVLLARELAAAGFPVLRFDFSGMGDSGGEFPGFDAVSDDIRAACDALADACPECPRLTLVGLCDGASAAAIYADTDSRVERIVMLNPWVHTEEGEARAFVWHYYPKRLVQRDFWRGLFAGKIAIGKALSDALAKLRLSRGASETAAGRPGDFISRMGSGLEGFSGTLHIFLSDTDLTAAGFCELTRSNPRWRALAERATVEHVNNADHTFSTSDAFEQFLKRCIAAVRETE